MIAFSMKVYQKLIIPQPIECACNIEGSNRFEGVLSLFGELSHRPGSAKPKFVCCDPPDVARTFQRLVFQIHCSRQKVDVVYRKDLFDYFIFFV